MKKIFFSVVHIMVSFVILKAFQLLGTIVTNIFSVNVFVDNIIYSIIYIGGVVLAGGVYAKFIMKDCFIHLKESSKKILLSDFLGALILPIVITLFFLIFTNGFFEKNPNPYCKVQNIISEAIVVSGITVISEEFIFRFLILRYLEIQWNISVAIIIQSILFAMAHIPSISSLFKFDTILLLVAGTMVGIMFSLVYLRANNLWSSIIFHMVWNVIIIGGIFIIESPNYGTTIYFLYRYNLLSSNKLLTGGIWKIEASLPAMIGYLCEILYLLCHRKR